MTAGLDYLKPYADTASSSSARKIEERRHGGWLLELERALLEKGMAKSTSRQHHATGDPSGRNQASSSFAFEGRAVTGSVPASAGGAYNAEPADRPAWARQYPSGAVEERDDIPRAPAPQRALDSNVPYRLPTQLQAANPKGDAAGIIKPQAQDIWSSRVTLHQGASDIPQDVPEHSTASGEQGEAKGTALSQDTEPFRDSEAYPRRKLHLFHGEDGVHAWIRDIDVEESKAHAIARTLNTELVASGKKLAALTLNGKRLAHLLFQDERFDEEGRGRGAALRIADAEDAPSPAMQRITEKGTY